MMGLLNMEELLILIDTLSGSLGIVERLDLFRYSKETREGLWKKLHNGLKNIEIEVKEGKDTSYKKRVKALVGKIEDRRREE